MLRYLLLDFLAVTLLCGCSIDISQTGGLASPQQLMTSNTARPPYSSAANLGNSRTAQPKSIAVTWGSLHLNGKLVYLAGFTEGVYLLVDVQLLDLSTGEVKTIFQSPVDAWIDAATVSPDGKNLLVSYAPPVGTEFGGRDSLYLLPLDGSSTSLQLLFTPESDKDRYFQSTWSPDGRYIYFTNATYGKTVDYAVMRMAYPNGKMEKLVDRAYWPAISADGSRLAYVTVDPATGKNRLFAANADGTQAQEIPFSGSIIDAPLFLQGDQTILFSAPPSEQALDPNWFEKVLGITVASAHAAVPSDWWSVPVTGGAATQITHLRSFALFGSLSPDGQYVASISSDVLFVMRPDGTNLTQLVDSIGGIAGTVNWIP